MFVADSSSSTRPRCFCAWIDGSEIAHQDRAVATMIGPYAQLPRWCWMYTVCLFSSESAAEVIQVLAYDCPPRPVPWYTWAYFGLSALLLVISSIWGMWDTWTALWEWLAKRRDARRKREGPKQ